MQNSERQPFEQSWKSAFDGAEMTPPDSLWNSIEMEVIGRETDVMKRRVVFYQRIAAATVIFALLSGALAVYNYRGTEEVASTTTPVPTQKGPVPTQSAVPAQSGTTPMTSPGTDATPSSPSNHQPGPSLANSDQQDRNVARGNRGTDNTNTTIVVDDPSGLPPVVTANREEDKTRLETDPSQTTAAVDEKAPAVNSDKKDAVNSDPSEKKEVVVAELLSADQINAMAEAKEKEQQKKKESQHAPWLGVGGAAGSYTPKAGGAMGSADAYADASSSYAAAQGIPQSVRHTVGSAYSAGLSGGVKLAKRWVVQSGVNYISQQVDYTTNFVGISNSNKATAMTSEFMDNSSLASVAVTNSYEASSTMEILSVPVQAGFLIVDRKLGWQLNTGVSTDFFLRNTLADKSGSREKISEGSGEDSPYRAVNWSGLLNTELSYRIGNHYRLALVPGIRYTFQPVLREQSTGSPLVLDLGFRFKYLFN